MIAITTRYGCDRCGCDTTPLSVTVDSTASTFNTCECDQSPETVTVIIHRREQVEPDWPEDLDAVEAEKEIDPVEAEPQEWPLPSDRRYEFRSLERTSRTGSLIGLLPRPPP